MVILFKDERKKVVKSKVEKKGRERERNNERKEKISEKRKINSNIFCGLKKLRLGDE
jgi:hypothetical protein